MTNVAATLTVSSELEARAAVVASVLSMVDYEIDRNLAVAGILFYNEAGRFVLGRLSSALTKRMHEMREQEITELAVELEGLPARLKPRLERAERQLPAMRVLERFAIGRVRRCVVDLETVIARLHAEVESRAHHAPLMSVAMHRQSIMAKTLLRHVPPDTGDHPDPDYGL